MLQVHLARQALQSRRGNALVMVLGLVAFVAVMTVEIYNSVNNMVQRSHQSSFRDVTDTLVASLDAQLDSPESCTKILGGLRLVPGTDMNLGSGDLKFIYGDDVSGPFSKGNEVARGVKLGSAILHVPARPDMDTCIGPGCPGAPPRWERYAMRLDLTFAVKSPGLKNTVQLNYTNSPGGGGPHNFYAWIDDSKRVSACFGKFSQGAFCNSAGGYYIVNLVSPVPSDQRCRQSIFTRINPGDPTEQTIGTCRFGGIRAAGTCPAGTSGKPFQDAFGSVPASVLCLRCQ